MTQKTKTGALIFDETADRYDICIKIKQRQILPGVPETHYPQTGSRAYEETPRPCYAIRAKKALFYGLLTAVSP